METHYHLFLNQKTSFTSRESSFFIYETTDTSFTYLFVFFYIKFLFIYIFI